MKIDYDPGRVNISTTQENLEVLTNFIMVNRQIIIKKVAKTVAILVGSGHVECFGDETCDIEICPKFLERNTYCSNTSETVLIPSRLDVGGEKKDSSPRNTSSCTSE